MLCALPNPLLSLSSETLLTVRGEEAASTIWSVFTKCKNYIEDGQRLEYISWRVWHHIYHSRHGAPPTSPSRGVKPSKVDVVESDLDSDTSKPIVACKSDDLLWTSELSSSSTPIPSSTVSITCGGTGALSLLTPASQKRSSNFLGKNNVTDVPVKRRRPSRKRSGSLRAELPVGQIICRILPDKLVIPSNRKCLFSPSDRPHARHGSPSLMRQDTDSGVAESIHENEDVEPERSPPLRAPLLVIPDSSPSSNNLHDAQGPRVVIVNPTPHPTPPATPEIHQASPNGFFTTQSLSLKKDTLSPPEIVPVMTLPTPAWPAATAASLRSPPQLASSPAASSSTASSDERPPHPTAKIFFMPKSSPQSQSPEKSLRMAPSTQIPNSTDVHEDQIPSSVASSNVRSIGSFSSSGKARKFKQHAGKRPSRLAASRGKLAATTAKGASSSISQPKGHGESSTATRTPLVFEIGGSDESRNRKSGPVAFQRGGSSSTKTTKDGSTLHPSDEVPESKVPRPSTLMRVATQPLPHAHQRPRNHVGFPPLPDLNLQEPLIPATNGRRRKVEIEKTSSEDDEDWSDVSDDAIDDEPSGDSEDEDADEGEVADEGILSKATKEVAYQKNYFTKLPSPSYTNLKKRTRSGLLTELFHPPVERFPEGHPYRTSRSHLDLVQKPRAPGQGPMLWFRQAVNGHNQSTVTPPPTTVKLSTSKSAAALPEMVKISAGATEFGSRGPYRPRGPPSNVDASDSGDEEGTDDALQMSKSVAHKRLEALAGPKRRPILRDDHTSSSSSKSPTSDDKPLPKAEATVQPVVIGYPYNLPPPDPPASPATTRRKMWETEMSQSTRISLLRERYQSFGSNAIERFPKRMSPEKAAEEQRRTQLLRNKSWAADDFHTSGW